MRDPGSILTDIEDKMRRRRSFFQPGGSIELFTLEQRESEQLEHEIGDLTELYKLGDKPSSEFIQKMRERIIPKIEELQRYEDNIRGKSSTTQNSDEKDSYYRIISDNQAEHRDLRKILSLLQL